MFETETKMVSFTIPLISRIFESSNPIIALQEPSGLFGEPDILLMVDDDIIAIEFKLSNWKRAMQQAFKYRSFANYSYVFLDWAFIPRALKYLDDFKRFNIGLYGIDENYIIECFCPERKEPYSENLMSQTHEMFETSDFSFAL